MTRRIVYRHSSSTKKMLLIASLLILAAFLVLWSMLFHPGTIRQLLPPSEMDKRLARVQMGQDRGQALKAYSDAWFHGECKYADDVIDDVFLYGSQDIRGVDVLVVSSHPSGGRMSIVNISPADRDLLRQYGFESCLPEFLLNDGITPTITQSH